MASLASKMANPTRNIALMVFKVINLAPKMAKLSTRMDSLKPKMTDFALHGDYAKLLDLVPNITGLDLFSRRLCPAALANKGFAHRLNKIA